MKKYKINKKVLVKNILVCVLIFIIFFAIQYKNHTEAVNVNNLKTANMEIYTVHKGDTLWSIARELNYNVDNRIVVDFICKTNNINANIKEGQTIFIPQPNSK